MTYLFPYRNERSVHSIRWQRGHNSYKGVRMVSILGNPVIFNPLNELKLGYLILLFRYATIPHQLPTTPRTIHQPIGKFAFIVLVLQT